uniref:Secreted protein n=1 Tax=Brassica oleracea TaxID=3712 RepID=A0A3P6DF66_BRAOL|nr:unnamed protein product [Brassica oleracea]
MYSILIVFMLGSSLTPHVLCAAPISCPYRENRFFLLRYPFVDPSFSKCHVTFPQMMSSAQGYRTGNLETDANYFYERTI